MKEKKTKTIKKDYKKAPLSKVHLRVMTAIALGQFTCGFSLGITGVAMNSAAKYIQISNIWTGLIGAGGVGTYITISRIGAAAGTFYCQF